jgi:hypothetical protein
MSKHSSNYKRYSAKRPSDTLSEFIFSEGNSWEDFINYIVDTYEVSPKELIVITESILSVLLDNEPINEKIAGHISLFTKTKPEFWLNIQKIYDGKHL